MAKKSAKKSARFFEALFFVENIKRVEASNFDILYPLLEALLKMASALFMRSL